MSKRSAKVVSLVEKTARSVARADVVAVLEEILAEAKEGKIISVAVAMVNSELVAETEWSGGENAAQLGGAIGLLDHRYNAALDKGEW